MGHIHLPPEHLPATDEELYQTRRFILDFEGPGIVRAAQRLGLSAGYLSQLLQGKRHRRLTTNELALLRGPYPPTQKIN